jgi:starvation-inducible outer membrane lipoprotein
MKPIAIITATLALTACTATPEMIAAQKDRCTQVGYAPGTVAHAQCTERGTAQQQQTQNAVAGSVVAGALNAAIWNSIWN